MVFGFVEGLGVAKGLVLLDDFQIFNEDMALMLGAPCLEYANFSVILGYVRGFGFVWGLTSLNYFRIAPEAPQRHGTASLAVVSRFKFRVFVEFLMGPNRLCGSPLHFSTCFIFYNIARRKIISPITSETFEK